MLNLIKSNKEMKIKLRMGMKTILMTFLIIFMSGCNEIINLHTIPIYKECVPALGNFLRTYKVGSVRSSIIYFDQFSEAHSSIVGYLEMEFLNKDEVKIYMNTVVAICHPAGVIDIPNTVRGREIVSNEFIAKYDGDNFGPYIVYKPNIIRLFYNEKITHWWRGL